MGIPPAERLMNLLLALTNTERYIDRGQIRTRVQGYDPKAEDAAFERMFERDKKDLRSLGIEIVTVTSPSGQVLGYKVDSGWSMPELELGTEELALLAIAAQVWQQASLGAAAIHGLRKIEAAVGADAPQASPRANLGKSEPAFAPLMEFISERRPVTFGYRKRHADPGEPPEKRLLRPWGLVIWEGHWYVVGHDVERDGVRCFRLSRIVGKPTAGGAAGAYEVPTDVVLRDLVGNFESGADYASIVVSDGVGHWFRTRALTSVPLGDGRTELSVPLEDEPALAGRIAALSDAAEVRGPQSLADEVRRRLEGAATSAPDLAGTGQVVVPPARAGGAEPAGARMARLLALMPWIAAHSPVKIAETAAHFKVSESQLEADLGLLSLSGLPGYTHAELIDIEYWETGGLIRVHNPQNLKRPVRLTSLEVASLGAALGLVKQIPGDFDRSAIEKLAGKLQQSAAAASNSGQSLDVRVDIPPGARSQIERALSEKRAMQLTYLVASRDEMTHRVVDPIEVVVVKGMTYLNAWCRSAHAERSFRLDRIHEAVVLDVPSEPPAEVGEFSLKPEGYVVRVLLERTGWWVVEQFAAEVTENLPDGRCIAELPVGEREWAIRLGLSLGSSGWVIGPGEFADEVRARAQRALKMLDEQDLARNP